MSLVTFIFWVLETRRGVRIDQQSVGPSLILFCSILKKRSRVFKGLKAVHYILALTGGGGVVINIHLKVNSFVHVIFGVCLSCSFN